MTAVVAAAVAGAAAAAAVGAGPAGGRLTSVLPAATVGRRPPPRASSGSRSRRMMTAAVGTGLAVAVLIGSWTGVVAGCLVGALVARRSSSSSAAEARSAERRTLAALPVLLDLVGAALQSGAAPAHALAAVADGDPGAGGRLFAEVAARLSLGADAEEAWRVLDGHPELARVVGAAVRGGRTGAQLADTCIAVAADLRAERLLLGQAAARRAGVVAVLPLAGCFLPAFVLVAVVPLVAGLLRSLDL